MSHLLHQWDTSSALCSKACIRPAPPIVPGPRPLAWPSPRAAVVALAAKAYLRSSLAPYRSLRTSIAHALCGCRRHLQRSLRDDLAPPRTPRPERQSCRRARPPDVCPIRFCAVYGVVSPTNDEVLLGYLDQGQWRSVSGCVFGSLPNL